MLIKTESLKKIIKKTCKRSKTRENCSGQHMKLIIKKKKKGK